MRERALGSGQQRVQPSRICSEGKAVCFLCRCLLFVVFARPAPLLLPTHTPTILPPHATTYNNTTQTITNSYVDTYVPKVKRVPHIQQ